MRFLKPCIYALILCMPPHLSKATCTSPSGIESQTIYDTDAHTPKFCNGTSWVALKNMPYTNYYSETYITINPTRGVWFNASDVSITIPEDGIYYISFSTRLYGLNADDNYWMARLYNTTQTSPICTAFGMAYVPYYKASAADTQTGSSRIIRLNKDDIIKMQYLVRGSGTTSITTIGNTDGGTSINAIKIAD